MPFNYACFISYRHGQRALVERIINDLSDALSSEIELWMREQVYVDRERLRGGDHYNEDLAAALCQSVCMIVVFTPRYFDKKSTFCAREYRAMESLEEQRLKLLPHAEDRRRGLIIPIVFRGSEYLPDEIRNRRQYYDFGDFLLSDEQISKHPSYAGKIREIAEYIKARHEAFRRVQSDPCTSCDSFSLPSDEDIRVWLDDVCSAPATQFVMRGNAE